jgi:hypothetical protein
MKPRPLRSAVTLSGETSRRLHSYALAASAAGVSVLALVSPAEGKIVYTPAHKVIKTGSKYDLDLNHDGLPDFTFHNERHSSSSECFLSVELSALPGGPANGIAGFKTVFENGWAIALKRGYGVGPRRYFVGRWMATHYQSVMCDTGSGGSWRNVKNRYLGFKFKINGKNHYGWGRLNVSLQGFSITATLTGYAYETKAGKAIIAGQTAEADPDGKPADSTESGVAPADSSTGTSLGILALGAKAIRAWRTVR